MPTHAELTGELLRGAASLFRNLAVQNESMADTLGKQAGVYTAMSDLIVRDPEGVTRGVTHAEMSARLLQEAAGFLRTLAEQNSSLQETMMENANIYDGMSDLIRDNPLGVLD
jgi:argininosuccinate lyase